MHFASLLTKQPHMLQKCAPSRAAFVLVAQPYAGCLALARGCAVAQPDCAAGILLHLGQPQRRGVAAHRQAGFGHGSADTLPVAVSLGSIDLR